MELCQSWILQTKRPLCEPLDTYGLSAIQAPARMADMTRDECAAFGEKARELGIVVGETGMWENVMTECS